MATESFYEDMIIDTPEALANLIAFAEEEPHLKVDKNIRIKHADEESMRRFVESASKKDRYPGRTEMRDNISDRSETAGDS